MDHVDFGLPQPNVTFLAAGQTTTASQPRQFSWR
jgi:hypothetical protein